MKIAETETAQGLPRVTWVQLMAKGRRGPRTIRRTILFGVVVGGSIGILTFSGSLWNIFLDAFIGAMICLAFLSIGAAKAPAEEFAKGMRKPILKKTDAEAEIARASDGRYTFTWMFKEPSGRIVGSTLPIDDFDTLEFGLSSEWYAGPHEQGDFSNMFVIVLHSASLGTQCIAAHAGTKAEVSTLHASLTRALMAGHRAASMSPPLEARRLLPTVNDELPETL